MLVTIRPSELCGMESRLPPEYRKPSYAFNGSPDTSTPRSTATSNSTIRAARRSSSSGRIHSSKPARSPGAPITRDFLTHPLSGSDRRRLTVTTPEEITATPRIEEPGRDLGSKRKKKHGVFSFLAPKDSTGKVLVKANQHRQEFVRVTSRHNSSRMSQALRGDGDSSLEAGRSVSSSSQTVRGKRSSIRPSLAGLSSGHGSSTNVASLAPRSTSLALQPTNRPDRLARSTTDLHAAHQSYVQRDRDDADHSFLFDFKQSPAAAYLLESPSLTDHSAYSDNSRTPRLSLISADVRQIVHRGDAHRSRAADTSQEATPSLTPTSARSPVEETVFWPYHKAAQVVVNERELPNREGQGWPLEPHDQSLAAQEQDLSMNQPRRSSFHVSSDSRTTNSTTEAIISPTFSTDPAVMSDATPSSSLDIQRIDGSADQTSLPISDETTVETASIAASETSEQWNQSPRERLGLGGNLKKVAVSPWEAEEADRRRLHRSRGSTAHKSTRSRRFSTLMGWTS